MRFAIGTRYPAYAEDMASGDLSTLQSWVAAATRHLSYQAERCPLGMPIEAATLELAEATRHAFGRLAVRAARRFS
jgi:hypothetical protein